MFDVNPWPWVYAALGLTYVVIAGYAVLLNRRRVAAEAAVRESGGAS